MLKRAKGTLFFLFALFFAQNVCANIAKDEIKAGTPATYKLLKDAVIKDLPDGRIVDIWFGGEIFTTYQSMGEWVRISGYFPDGRWEKNQKEYWVNRKSIKEIYRPKEAKKRPKSVKRYIVIDKSDYELKVFEERARKKKILYKAKVAVGMDKCLPEEEGGNCYFTDPGEYKIRWKIYDEEGIEWCIPKFMEKEKKYKDDLARNKRCFRGSLGYHALNIGKSYAIHGTNNESSIGKNASHGCVRAKNEDMDKIFSLMEVGDQVYIVR